MQFPQYLRYHRKDDDTPYAIGGVAGVLALAIVGLFAFASLDNYLLRSGSLAAVISSVLVELANGDRASASVGGLTVSPVLTRVAEAKAADMAAKSYFAHTSPDGREPWYWFAQEGYQFAYAGENLAVDFTDSVQVESAWMNSPEHRANLLNGHYTEIGIATAEGTFNGHPTTFVVQEFGTPAQVQVPVQVALAPPPARARVPANPTEPAEATGTPTVAAATEQAPPAPAATTPAPAPAPAAGVPARQSAQAPSWLARIAASPRTALSYAYYALAALILILFAYATELEWHKRHLRHVVAAGSLFALMAALFVLGDLLIFSRPVLAAFGG